MQNIRVEPYRLALSSAWLCIKVDCIPRHCESSKCTAIIQTRSPIKNNETSAFRFKNKRNVSACLVFVSIAYSRGSTVIDVIALLITLFDAGAIKSPPYLIRYICPADWWWPTAIFCLLCCTVVRKTNADLGLMLFLTPFLWSFFLCLMSLVFSALLLSALICLVSICVSSLFVYRPPRSLSLLLQLLLVSVPYNSCSSRHLTWITLHAIRKVANHARKEAECFEFAFELLI